MCSLSSPVMCLMEMPINLAAILNVFCLSVCLTRRHLFGFSILYTHWPVSPTLPLSLPPSSIHDHFPSGFRHSPSLSPFSNYLYSSPLSSSLVPTAPFIFHLSVFSPFVSSLFPLPHIHPFHPHSLLIFLQLFMTFNLLIPNPAPFKTFPIFPALFPDEDAGHVHGTQTGGDWGWPSGGMWWSMTVTDVNFSLGAFSRSWTWGFNILTPCPHLYHSASFSSLI